MIGAISKLSVLTTLLFATSTDATSTDGTSTDGTSTDATSTDATAEPSAAKESTGRPLLITGARVITMTGSSTALDDHAIRIEEGRIAWIGPSRSAPKKAADLHVDANGKFVIPGLIDAHVHLFDQTQLPLYVANGVTTVFNLSGNPWVLDLRDQIEENALLGPSIFTTGPQVKDSALSAVDTEATLPSPDKLPAFVRSHRELGYDFLKVWSSIRPYQYEGLLAECRKQGVRATGHIPSRVGLRGVIAAGQRSVAHVEELLNKFFVRNLDPDGLDVVRLIAAKEALTVTSTLITYEMIADTMVDDRLHDRLARDQNRYIDPALLALWSSEQNDWYQLRNASRPDGYYDHARDFLLEITKALHDGGSTILAGSDSGLVVSNILPGFSLHRELELIAESGLSPEETLLTATAHPGRFLDPASGLGTIALGAPANLCILDRDPLEHIGATRDIHAVVLRGKIFDRSDLDELLRETEKTQEIAARFRKTLDAEGFIGASEQIRRRDPEDSIPHEASFLIAAYHQAAAGELETATDTAKLATLAFPDSYRSWLFLGGAHELAGESELAREAFQQALSLRPDHPLLRARFASER